MSNPQHQAQTVTMPVVPLGDALSMMPTRKLRPGDYLIEQGGAPGAVYVMVSGRVEIERDGEPICAYREPGSMFGEIAVLMRQPNAVSVRATDPTEMTVIEDFEKLFQGNTQYSYKLAQSLAGRLAATDALFAETRKTLHEFIGDDSDASQTDAQKSSIAKLKKVWEDFGELMRTKIV